MNKNIVVGSVIVGAAILLLVAVMFRPTQPAPQSQQVQVTQTPKANQPAMEIDKTKKYQAILNTDSGQITVDLYADKTPITVNNFVALSRKKFYDGTPFHRVIKNFMIQGGDPDGNGTGGPGYTFDDEPFEGEYSRGTIAMANRGPNTNGSQFFILHKDYPLPPDYVIFGKVSKGIEVVDKIAEAEVKQGQESTPSIPVTPVKVMSIEILEK